MSYDPKKDMEILSGGIPEEWNTAEGPCWLVWEVRDQGRVYLRAVDLSEGYAERHAAYLRMEAFMVKKPIPNLFIEKSRINHLYAASVDPQILHRT